MPELPEVETIVRELNRELPGRRVSRVRIFRGDALEGAPEEAFRAGLEGRSFGRVSRRGKYLLFALDSGGSMVAHLRMTGKFVLSALPRQPGRHMRVWFELDDGRALVFQDLRCLGTLGLSEDPLAGPPLSRLGMEPLSEDFTAERLATALAGSRSPLKHWLMDQRRIAGLGNIYASEIMFASRLDPVRPAGSLSGPEGRRLHRAVVDILALAVEKNGTTISDYARVDDKSGEFQHFLKVYGRTGQPCPECETPIRRIVQQQRSTFFCPRCQN
ncbi:MAG: bifunctional DNA-formamidopyrimidine glycosylase/DNA-(apurinic or apyrimidinic site) lyase [Deltaproteobacteria bacterium]|nr:bifunctional DNA-formamidopyrimidine glycosylase/DNA-(apurinic or apyrimidinic site) lyase [Deltaproteobacteria bacterium]